jgi:hypothetical protein
MPALRGAFGFLIFNHAFDGPDLYGALSLRVSRCAFPSYMLRSRDIGMAIQFREIYRSAPNGDRWLLARSTETGRVFVRHEPNLPSGGQLADIEIGAFLLDVDNRPEKQELLRLIGTLV